MLERHEVDKIIDAVKAEGTYNPDEVMYLFEESLTFAEYDKIKGFLSWVHDTGSNFGWGNIQAVYSQYTEAKNE